MKGRQDRSHAPSKELLRSGAGGILVSEWIRDSSSESGALTMSTIATASLPIESPFSWPLYRMSLDQYDAMSLLTSLQR